MHNRNDTATQRVADCVATIIFGIPYALFYLVQLIAVYIACVCTYQQHRRNPAARRRMEATQGYNYMLLGSFIFWAVLGILAAF